MGKAAKVPVIMQMEVRECGAACLSMILAYYGKWVTLEQARIDCGISRDGSKASNILEAARRYGLRAKGMVFTDRSLREQFEEPCILFWNFNHFVVLTGFRGNYACINDPARGRIKVPLKEYEECFTGVALLFEKTDSFEEGGEKPNNAQFIRDRLDGLWPAIAISMFATAIVSVATILSTAFGRVFLDRVFTGRNPEWCVPLVILMLMIALVSGTVSVLNAVNLNRIRGKVAVVGSSRFMRHLLHLPMRFYSQRTVGDLQQRLSVNESIAYQLIGQLAPVLINACMLILYMAIMLKYSALLTFVGIATVIINAVTARKISDSRVNIARSNAVNTGKLFGATVGGLGMIETIKAAGAEDGFFERWAGYQAAANEGNARMTAVNEYLGIFPSLMSSIANILVLTLGMWLIIRGDFTPGALLAFTGFLSSFMSPVSQIISLGQTVQEMRTDVERVDDVLRYPADVPEERGADAMDPETAKLEGNLEVRDVSFGYSPLDPPLIEHFDLSLKTGQWVAIVGGSGSGKSTIGKLISGLYEPWSGEILFDGIPASDIPRAVRCGSLAVVDQDIVSFDDSVLDNIRLWDCSIEDFEVILASRDAGVHEVIAAREGSYASRVLPGGRNFSGGELQRMEIARVLAQDPIIVILDEATSALDADTEAEVIKHIRDRGITCIVVAHRLSTIRDCDEIIVLDHGKVKERGTHSELLEKNGAYAELVRND